MSSSAASLGVAVAITTQTVSKLTTFELRKELERRGCMDLEDAKINHKALLQRLIQELVRDESLKAEEKVNADASKLHEERDAEKRLREQRKQEALERSRARQSDPAYFQRISELSKEGKEVLDAKKAEAPAAAEEDEKDIAEGGAGDDPFRATGKKTRSKVFVR